MKITYNELAGFGKLFKTTVTTMKDDKPIHHSVTCEYLKSTEILPEVWAKIKPDFGQYFKVEEDEPIPPPKPVEKPAEKKAVKKPV